ncbi:MAG: hypothetical protein K6T86_03525, partial [Pirellulales bacterium]|nr:hypothetical protein [Pirellulales bacterium]
MKHDVDPTDADFERPLSADLKRTGEANSEAVDDGNALQGMEAAKFVRARKLPATRSFATGCE